MKSDNEHIKSGLFGYLLALTAIFCLFEISFFVRRSVFYLADFKEISAHLHVPLAVLPGMGFFIFAQVVVHFVFTLLIWLVTRLVGIALRCSWQQIEVIGFSLWGFGIATVMFANQYYFPNSQFAEFIRLLMTTTVAEIVFLFCCAIWAIILVIALVGFVFILAAKQRRVVSSVMLSVLAIAMAVGLFAYQKYPPVIQDASSISKPNIILIGVDALRPDFLGYFGYADITPHIDTFLNGSIVFAEALTPIARTFPAWVSLLSGEYPKKTHARFDLADQSQLNFSNMLPVLLQHQGYKTIYAMDETRFSNVTPAFGFDQIITPPTGFNDFLLGTLNDFPLSNLVINLRVGRWLFPYSYANRPAYATYDPDSFLQLLKPALAVNRTQPLFLTVHLCLSHYPYLWSTYFPGKTSNSLTRYQSAVHRVDQQVGDLLALLQKNGMLEHSIVVLLSDHGEALELSGDRITGRKLFITRSSNKNHTIPHFYPPAMQAEKVNRSAGHGTDVLGLSQYHSVLAFRLYGMGPLKPRVVPGMVSLIDIKPTLLSLLGVKFEPESGVSLSPVILEKAIVTSQRDLFIESDFSPAAVRTVYPEMRKVLFQGIDLFVIDPVTLRLTVKKSMGERIISSKQYAVVRGAWILALYPEPQGVRVPILVNLETGQWTNDLRLPFATQSPAKQMLQALTHFYGREISTVVHS